MHYCTHFMEMILGYFVLGTPPSVVAAAAHEAEYGRMPSALPLPADSSGLNRNPQVSACVCIHFTHTYTHTHKLTHTHTHTQTTHTHTHTHTLTLTLTHTGQNLGHRQNMRLMPKPQILNPEP